MSWPPDESSSRRPRISRRPDESQAAPRQGDSRQDSGRQDNGRRDYRENRGTPRQGEFRRDFRADSGAPRTPYQRDDRSASRPERPYPRAERSNAYQEPQERNLSLSMGDADSAPQTAVGGMREVEELLRNDPSRVHRVLFRLQSGNPKLYTLQKLARKQHIHVQQVEGRVLEQYAVPNGGVVALCHEKDVLPWLSVRDDLFAARESGSPRLVAVATNIEDPRNLGACIRSSLALGVDVLLMPSRGMCGLTPAVARAAAGALEKLRICRPDNLESALSELVLSGYQLVGLDAETETRLPGFSFSDHTVVAVGGEDRGLPPFIRKQCAAILRIPMKKDAHSYNASVALSLGLYEVARTRLQEDVG